ncbi:putative F-box domain-containing protein [Medicago truncatula]|uniref:Putative F-box domain-containing protein n=1 Tax=Medicago truncatula TaxID=3880 RepID=A0A396H5N8_MEDTR|nr:putative F-box domain-containing protein [Medicago truncatula]
MNTKSARFFPNDLITEVLSVLPVKSIIRFRCVSNSWNILISDSTFVKFHLKRSKARNPFFTLITDHFTYTQGESPYGSDDESEYDRTVVPYSIRSLIENPSFNLTVDPYYELNAKGCSGIVGTCNGICLLDSFDGFLLWNPSTRETSKSFDCDFDFSGSDHSGFMFGCDDSTDIYKVVAFSYSHAHLKNDVRVLNFGDDRWRNIESFPAVPLQIYTVVDYVYLSGTINWLAIHNEYCYPESNIKDITVDQFVIVSLDLGTEKYNQYRLPPSFDEVPSAYPIVGF